MEIPEIGTNEIDIRELDIPPVLDILRSTQTYNVTTPLAPPVVVNIGLPIVDMPGCVEAHQTNNPKNNEITSDDPKGTKTICDAGVPSFDPLNFEPEQIIPTYPAGVDTRTKPEESKSPETETPEVPKTPVPKIQCPTPEQLEGEPVGFIFDNGRKEIVGYKLEGLECKRIIEDVPIPAQIINAIPPASTITTTASIAVVATTSALLAKPFADILLKVIKPTVKKVLKKVAAIRGKQMKILSVEERRVEQRDRNQAIAKLKSVQVKTKKKG